MLQAGCLIPVDEQSEMGVFKQLFLDIGDAQSIEYELSTYSSHLKTMKYFVEFSDNKTLFLIDELGSGTDPALGGAFAEVILEKLAQEKAYGVVTTHYLNLKVMADKVKGVINGAMAFDEVNLLPLYKLSVGKPGSSHTFSIAQRSGLPKALIDRAKTLVDIDHIRYDHLLSSIEYLEKEVEKKDVLLKNKDSDIATFRKEVGELKSQAQRQIEKTKQQIQSSSGPSKFQREAERKLQKLLQDWENRQATHEHEQRLVKATQALLKEINPVKSSSPSMMIKKDKQPSKMDQVEFVEGVIKVGSIVVIKQFQQKGKVVKILGKKAQIDTGGMIMSVEIESLGLLE
jgi:DNA mismatch repair protein MutS2